MQRSPSRVADLEVVLDADVLGRQEAARGQPPTMKRLPLFAAYAKAVFCIMVSSAIVESLFSKYGYTRSKARSSMIDGTAASILLTHELDDIVKSVREPFSQIFALRAHALTDRLNWN